MLIDSQEINEINKSPVTEACSHRMNLRLLQTNKGNINNCTVFSGFMSLKIFPTLFFWCKNSLISLVLQCISLFDLCIYSFICTNIKIKN